MKPRKWELVNLERLATESKSLRQLIGKLGLRQAGGNYTQVKKYLALYKINTEHFLGKGWNVSGKNLIHQKAIPLSKILAIGSKYQSYKLKRRLFAEGIKGENCEKCGWAQRASDGRIPLELHHINGDREDNRLLNLQVLCPNCHSLEPNHRGRNIAKK